MSPLLGLPTLYGYVLLTSVIMGFSILLIGFFVAGRVRERVFSKEYLKANFGEQHKNQTGQQISSGGYPDNGNGYYSRNLKYKDWYDFNNSQRAHVNYVEVVAASLVLLLIAGLYFPIPASIVGAAMVIGRILYAVGYSWKGPQGRIVGALVFDLALLAQFCLAIISSVYFLKGSQFPK